MFTTIDKEKFDFENFDEDNVRIAYVFKDDSHGGYMGGRLACEIAKAFRILLGCDEE